jgi:hypothetical protein
MKVKGEDGNLVNVKIPKVYPIKYVIRATEEKREFLLFVKKQKYVVDDLYSIK